MDVLTVFMYVYLIIGFTYGFYLLFNGASTIWGFPINVLGGPIVLVYVIYKTLKREKIRYP